MLELEAIPMGPQVGKEEASYILRLSKGELDYVGVAVGQFDIEFQTAPKSLVRSLRRLAKFSKSDTLGWA